MNLKITRSQRETWLLKTPVFKLTFRGEFTREEEELIRKYHLFNQELYTSGKRMSRALSAAAFAQAGHPVLSLVQAVRSGFALKLKTRDLVKGKRVESKSLAKLLEMEDMVIEQSNNLHFFLESAKSFDGRDDVIEIPVGDK